MNANSTDELTAEERTERRATWESFEYSVPTPGVVVVRNTSYGDDSADHVYAVNVSAEAGSTSDCTCPANTCREEPCKHRVAVEANQPVMLAASSELATDGGTTATDPLDDVTRTGDCGVCEDTGSRIRSDVACFACVIPGGAE